MHEVGFPVDLNWFTQLIVTLFFLSIGVVYLVRSTAAKYFEVGGAGGFDRDHRRDHMAADMADAAEMECAVCGKVSSKKCSRCKAVRYCSSECQKSDWNSGHKRKCMDPGSTNSAPTGRTAFGNRFASRIALVPRQGQNKTIRKPREVLFPYNEFVKYFNWDKEGFVPCGLTNCGNSCFANVVLQCLSWTRPLVAYLLEKGHKRECRRNDWCFFCEFETHVERVSRSQVPFSPMNIISRLTNIGGNLGYGRQEDAHEFMRFAIDTMQSACLEEFGGERAVPPHSQETTLIQHIFGGHLQSQVMCTVCNNVSDLYENMMDLTVEIHGDAVSLEECLDQFTAKEWLQGENMYKCDRCNDYVKAWKRLMISRAPNILTIALKRFQGGRFGKLNKRVSFPEMLDISPYMSGGDGMDVYKLYAVIVHLDMLNAAFFGHYICYIRDFHGNWYRIDDSEVEKVELEDVLSQRAYMLLYFRIQARPSHLREAQNEKKTETIEAESSQNGAVSATVGANGSSNGPVPLISNGHIPHLEETGCGKESSARMKSENGTEHDEEADATDVESNASVDMEGESSAREHEPDSNGKLEPTGTNLAVDSGAPTLSPSNGTNSSSPAQAVAAVDTMMSDA